jgi:ADP-ribose pyrophosphatase YjhB (NUDIX family)
VPIPYRSIYPDRLSISVTGRVQAGESSNTAMRRELQEALGLSPADVKIDFLFSFKQDATINAT